MRVPGCSPASTDRERCPPLSRRDLGPLPVSAVQRSAPFLVSTASRSQISACAWSTSQDLPTPRASDPPAKIPAQLLGHFLHAHAPRPSRQLPDLLFESIH